MKSLLTGTAVVALGTAMLADASCYKFYTGLCPGDSSCMCTLKEACGAVGDIARATNSEGGCSGECLSVVHNKCAGDSTCLEAGATCHKETTVAPVPNPSHNGTIAIQCAKEWADAQIPYCQCNGEAECCGSCPYCSTHFRCDCSGFVSYCLGLKYGYNTRTLTTVAHEIIKDDLQPGDMMLCSVEHVVFFAGWTDNTKTHFVCYQEPGCHTSGPHHAFMSVIAYPFNFNPTCFLPYRVNADAGIVSAKDAAEFEQSEAGERILRARGGFKTFIKDQPLHVPNPNGDSIAPRSLVEEAAKNAPSYPYEFEKEALEAAEGIRNHLRSLGIEKHF